MAESADTSGNSLQIHDLATSLVRLKVRTDNPTQQFPCQPLSTLKVDRLEPPKLTPHMDIQVSPVTPGLRQSMLARAAKLRQKKTSQTPVASLAPSPVLSTLQVPVSQVIQIVQPPSIPKLKSFTGLPPS